MAPFECWVKIARWNGGKKGTIFGFYNHGILRVGGNTQADVILSDDYTMELSGAASCRYALGSVDRMKNIPVDFANADLELVLDPEVMDSHNGLKESEIIQQLSRGGRIKVATEKQRQNSLNNQRQPMEARLLELGELIEQRHRDIESYVVKSQNLAEESERIQGEIEATRGKTEEAGQQVQALVDQLQTVANQRFDQYLQRMPEAGKQRR